MLVEGNQPLQEKRQQTIESITLAINQTVERVRRHWINSDRLLLEEKRQQTIESITLAINQTVKRVKEALDKQRPPSPRERLTDEQSKSCKKPKFLK
nr:homeobox domain-containing protein/START domain-containing protein [Tanacetum cinerariifolium]